MTSGSRHLAWRLILYGLVFASVGTASAEGPAVSAGPSAPIVVELLVQPGEGSVHVIERVELATLSSQIGWIRTFPSPPQRVESIPPADLSAALALAKPAAPRSDQMRSRLFGPSIVTLLTAAGKRHSSRRSSPSALTQLGSFVRFSKTASTASTSAAGGAIGLPAALERWLEAARLELSEAQRRSIEADLNRGWVALAGIFDNPSQARHVSVGPIRYVYASATPQIGGSLFAGARGVDLYIVADGPMAPAGVSVGWDEPTTALAGRYAEAGLAGAAPWAALGLGGGAAAHLVRIEGPPEGFVGDGAGRGQAGVDGLPPGADLVLEAAPSTPDYPGPLGRGRWLDLLLCLLLSLTPLIYTPESWFLLWLERRPRRPDAPPPFLWAGYAALVGLFWVMNNEGAGRLAAFPPLALAAARLWRSASNSSVRERAR